MLRWTSILALIAINVAAMAADESSLLPNLVEDTSLEGYLGNNGLPGRWEAYPGNFAKCWVYTQKGGRTGERHLRMQSTGDICSIIAGRFHLKSGATQRAQLWYRPAASEGGKFGLFVTYYAGDGAWLGNAGTTVVLDQIKDRQEWQSIEVTNIGGKIRAARSFSLEVAMFGPGVVLLDDFVLTQTEPLPGDNMLPHGNMELTPEELPKAFLLVKPEESEATYGLDEQNPHGGKTCLHVVGKAPWIFTNFIDLEIPPGKNLRGAAWKRGNPTKGNFRLYGWNDKGKVFELYTSYDVNQDWEEAQWTLTPEQIAGATRMTVEMGHNGEFDVYYDDVSVWFEDHSNTK